MTTVFGTTTKDLRRDLRGEPFVPPRFDMFVWHQGGWMTERALNGQLPSATTNGAPPPVDGAHPRIWTERAVNGQLPRMDCVLPPVDGHIQVRISPLEHEECCCWVW
jgi:hypothetical protein